MNSTIKYTVARRIKFTQLFDPEEVVSVMEIESHYGKSLAVCLKYGTDSRIFPGYGDWRVNGPIVFIPLDNFTYHIPRYVALPKEQYSNIVIMTKIAKCEEQHMGTFYKATITKKVTW